MTLKRLAKILMALRELALLATAHTTVPNCEDCFIIKFYLISLISGQKSKKIS